MPESNFVLLIDIFIVLEFNGKVDVGRNAEVVNVGFYNGIINNFELFIPYIAALVS